jgi:XTP/dITP diphosphohydrolase
MTPGRRFTGDRLIVATHNRGKLEEFAGLFARHGVRLSAAGDLGLPEPAETETTFEGNARIKALAAALATGLPALADDSGIEVDALGGAPGVYTADWATRPDGTRDFAMAMDRLHAALAAAGKPEPQRARFRCSLVLAWPDGHTEAVDGVVEGQVIWPKRGAEGHGFDPMFLPDGHDRTFAEMPLAEKNRISHRAVALALLMERCFT